MSFQVNNFFVFIHKVKAKLSCVLMDFAVVHTT